MRIAIALLFLAIAAVNAEIVLFMATDPFEPDAEVCPGGIANNGFPPPLLRTQTDAILASFVASLQTDEDQIPKHTFEDAANGLVTPFPKELEFIPDTPNPDLVDFTSNLICNTPPCRLAIKSKQSDGAIAPCESINGRFANDGQKWLDVEFNDDFEIRFTEPVKGFAFYASDIGDVGGSLALTIQREDNSFVLAPDGSNQFILYDANVAGEARSALRQFWGIFTDSQSSEDWFSFIKFNKTGPTGNENDGFGFDTFYALPDIFEIPIVDPCKCRYIYNFGDGSACANSYSITGPKCACIRFETDLARGQCEEEVRDCSAEGSELPGGDPQSGGGNGGIPAVGEYDPSTPFVPKVIRYGDN